MAAFNKIKVGQTLYTITCQGGWSSARTRRAVHTIVVKEIDTANRRVLAVFNCVNDPRWYTERHVDHWKVNKPKLEPIYDIAEKPL